jgi:hypothetical protein
LHKLLFFLFFFTVSAHANLWHDQLNGSGSVRSGYWGRDREFSDERDLSSNSILLKLRPQLGKASIVIDGILYNNDTFNDRATYGDLREFYLQHEFGSFDLKIGRQIILWGRGDKVNPTDNLTVKDFRRLFAQDEGQLSGVGAVQLSYNLSDYDRLIMIWMPEWRPSYYLMPPTSNTSVRETRPEDNTKQYALKFDHSGQEFDWSISWFEGYDKVGDFKLGTLTAGVQHFDKIHNRQKVIGADWATTSGSYNWRGELAYTDVAANAEADFFKKNSNWFGVLGFDRNFASNFNLNLQVLYRSITDFQDPEDVSSASLLEFSRQAALYFGQDKKEFVAEVVRISHKSFNETLESEVVLVGWFSETYFVRPQLTYSYSDEISGSLGAEIYGGDRDTFFGRLKDLNSAFLELRYGF